MLWQYVSNQEYRFKGFLANDAGVVGEQPMPGPILCEPEEYRPAATDRLVLAIGNMTARRRVTDALVSRGAQFLTMVHPTAIVAHNAQLGHGVLLYPYSVVSSSARLADFVKLNYFASVGHDTQLGRLCLLAPYATVNGFGVLEDEVYLSTHATVVPQVRVGARSTVSANSAVMQSVGSDSFVFGVPGRVVPHMRFH